MFKCILKTTAIMKVRKDEILNWPKDVTKINKTTCNSYKKFWSNINETEKQI